jgi:predicted negative regulator of RcsB-dependent stress response
MNTNENNKNLERFIRDNREAFDHMEPSPALWDKIGATVGEASPQKHTRVISMSRARWAVAATLFLALAGTLGYMFYNRGAEEVRGSQVAVHEKTIDPLVSQIDPQYAKLVSQFTEVIETKQSELKKIEKDDPELYQKFSGDIQKLDSAYHALRGTLNANPNTEQLLQAMISNLQMQIDLLNQQLTVIKKIKEPKSQKI